MATKKTKNAKNATEYIDSAGVKLNNNADLIIEANKDGEVISARNLLNNTEYVGGGSGGGALRVTAELTMDEQTSVLSGTASHSATEIISALDSGTFVYFDGSYELSGVDFRAIGVPAQVLNYDGNMVAFSTVSEAITLFTVDDNKSVQSMQMP